MVNCKFDIQRSVNYNYLLSGCGLFNDLLSFCLLVETILKPDLEDMSLNFLCGGDSVH